MTSTAPTTSVACGIDIGGSGVKSALVDLATGTFIGERVRIDTPEEATPEAVAEVCRRLLEQLQVGDDVPVGVALPAPIVHGTVPFMANLDKSWTGVNLTELMREHLGRPVTGLNDADAAGLAEVAFGAAKDVPGTIIVTTLGTGIGSAVIVDGTLVPNTELGHLEIDGYDAESQASAGQRTAQDLSWKKWAKRLQRYYAHVEMLFSPDLFVVGGGVSRKHEKYPAARSQDPDRPGPAAQHGGHRRGRLPGLPHTHLLSARVVRPRAEAGVSSGTVHMDRQCRAVGGGDWSVN